jgi:hypothetical protein
MIAAGLLLAALAPAQLTELSVEPRPHHLAVAALGADGGNRLVSLTGRLLRLVEEPDVKFQFPGESVLWTVADLDADARDEVLLLVDGRDLVRIERRGASLAASEPILTDLNCLPPRGVLAAAFVRDLDGDGRNDLLLPLGARVRVLLGTAQGFRAGPDLGAVAHLALETGSGSNLIDHVGRSYLIPGLTPEDTTGDGRPDLVVSEGMLVRQFVATGSGLPEQPTRTIDLDPYRRDPDQVDLDVRNLSQLVRTFVVEEWEDLNGDGAEDLLVLGDGKVRAFLGSATGVDASTPVKTLKVDGNPFYIACAKLDEDEHSDLVVVRVEDIGILKLARAAFFSWSIHFDFLVYRGLGDGGFATRPLYNRDVSVKGERLLSFAKDQNDRLAALRKTVVRRADLDGDGVATDVVMLDPAGALSVWRGVAPAGSPGTQAREKFLQDTLGARGREVALEADDLAEWVLGRTSALVALTRSRPPDARIELPGGWEAPHTLALRDLNGDRKDEAIVMRRIQEVGKPARLLGFRVVF